MAYKIKKGDDVFVLSGKEKENWKGFKIVKSTINNQG